MIEILPQLIDQVAQKTPNNVAFRFKESEITYQALAQQTNSLAHALQACGVKKGDRVGIHLHKSLESAIAVYGILKAGAAYVPLDPMMPVSRLAYIIEDCQLSVMISQDQKRKNFRALAQQETRLQTVIGLSDDADLPFKLISWETINTDTQDSPPQIGLTPQDIAYIMYTSGSTGTPKGIIHTHFSGLSYARIAAETYGLSSQDRLANFAPLHFDQSTFEYFSSPFAGATTVIVPEEYTLFPANLSKMIEDEKITIWYSVPFALIQLLQRGVLEERDLSSLRWVLYGGEPFPPKHLRALLQQMPNAIVSNVYGPAEVNQCTYYHFDQVPEGSDEPIPIGKVWAETEGIVVDDSGNPVVEGEVGELLICSPTMMQGYWNRPDLNEHAFYHRTDGPGQTDIFYRTGDLVQVRPDGQMLFLGRSDRQVKSRGYRIELDEVEAALLSHSSVAEAAVFPMKSTDDGIEIYAAVILKAQEAFNRPALVKHLSDRVPRYAIPVDISQKTTFPRTTSGKIDRRAMQLQMTMAR